MPTTAIIASESPSVKTRPTGSGAVDLRTGQAYRGSFAEVQLQRYPWMRAYIEKMEQGAPAAQAIEETEEEADEASPSCPAVARRRVRLTHGCAYRNTRVEVEHYDVDGQLLRGREYGLKRELTLASLSRLQRVLDRMADSHIVTATQNLVAVVYFVEAGQQNGAR